MENQIPNAEDWSTTGFAANTHTHGRHDMTYYLCRLCAFKCLMPGTVIFSAEGMLRDIQRKIHECLQFLVTEDDTYPKIVCPDCVYKLDTSYEFKMKSHQSQNVLCELLRQETLGHNCVPYNAMSFQTSELHDLQMPDELPDQSVIRDLENFVQMNGDSGDIGKIMDYSDPNVGVSEYGMQQIASIADAENEIEAHGERLRENASMPTSDISEMIEYKYDDAEYPDDMNRHCGEIEDSGQCENGQENMQHLETEHEHMEQMMSYHGNHVPEYEAISNHEMDNAHDNVSLPDITLYAFDSISDVVGATENPDIDIAVPDFTSNSTDGIVDNACDKSSKFRERLSSIGQEIDEIYNPKDVPVVPAAIAPKNNNKSKVCGDCGKSFNTNYKLKEHQKTHSSDTPYHCTAQNCMKKFRSKIGLAQHEAAHSGNFKFSCNFCGKGFEIKSYLTIHMKTHSSDQPYKCSICSMGFKAKQGLINHENRHLGLRPFECSVCQKRFTTKGSCEAHQQTHFIEEIREHQCYVCLKSFTGKSVLSAHMKIHMNDKKFVCDFCGKSFLGRTDLKLHETTHTNERNYICDTCGKTFSRPSGLKRHLRIHLDYRPHKCNICSQTFTQSGALKIHKRTHTGDKPFACTHEGCPMRFISRTAMVRHRLTHNKTGKSSTNNSENCDMNDLKTD